MCSDWYLPLCMLNLVRYELTSSRWILQKPSAEPVGYFNECWGLVVLTDYGFV